MSIYTVQGYNKKNDRMALAVTPTGSRLARKHAGLRGYATLAVLVFSVGLLSGGCDRGPTMQLEVVLNPYQQVDWQITDRQKANFHTHTTQSDGHFVPHKVVDMYHDHGYSVLAITDHDHLTWPWTNFSSMQASDLSWRRYRQGDIDRPDGYENRDPDILGMFAPPGNELSRNHHTVSLFSEFIAPLKDLHGVLDELAEFSTKGLAMLAHPAMHWPGWFAPETGLRISLMPEIRSVTTGDFTIESWFRTDNSGRNILMGNVGFGAGALNLELHTGNRIRVYIDPAGTGAAGSATVDLAVDPAYSITDGQWHHLAAVRSGNEVRLYLNGEQVARATDTAGSYELAGETFYLGQDHRGGMLAFSGDLDHMRLWSRALSPSEMSGIVRGTMPNNRRDLLFEFKFEQTDSEVSALKVVDTGADDSGPYHGAASEYHPPEYVTDVAPALQQVSTRALTIKPSEWERVPNNALAMYLELYERHRHLVAMEVHNGTRPLHEYPLDKNLWDRLLSTMMPDRPVWGTATDDMHSMHHFAGDWVEFPMVGNEAEQVRQAFLDGAFYFSSISVYSGSEPSMEYTPVLTNVQVDQELGIIRIEATEGGRSMNDEAYVWVSMEQVVHTGPELDLSVLDETATYVRAEVYGRGGTTYTQPFGLRLLTP